MNKSITFVFLLILLTSSAQKNEFFVGKIVNDTNSFKSIPKHQNHLSPLLKSENKIEIRFVKSPTFSPTEYTVLKFNTEWEIEKSVFDPLTKKYVTIKLKTKATIDTVFAQLVNNRIFSIQDHDSIDFDSYTITYHIDENNFTGFGTTVYDGNFYAIEYKVGNYFRRYGYFNPELILDTYKLVPDLISFVEILNIFNEIK